VRRSTRGTRRARRDVPERYQRSHGTRFAITCS
jgi:hypothetical protein